MCLHACVYECPCLRLFFGPLVPGPTCVVDIGMHERMCVGVYACMLNVGPVCVCVYVCMLACEYVTQESFKPSMEGG